MSKRVVYGNAWSENGWSMVNVDECANEPFPGTGVRVPLRSGPPDVILKAFGSLFNDRIEELDQSQCGGWTPTNDVPTSNHLAGTGMDLNWRRHPFHVSGTSRPSFMNVQSPRHAQASGIPCPSTDCTKSSEWESRSPATPVP